MPCATQTHQLLIQVDGTRTHAARRVNARLVVIPQSQHRNAHRLAPILPLLLVDTRGTRGTLGLMIASGCVRRRQINGEHVRLPGGERRQPHVQVVRGRVDTVEQVGDDARVVAVALEEIGRCEGLWVGYGMRGRK